MQSFGIEVRVNLEPQTVEVAGTTAKDIAMLGGSHRSHSYSGSWFAFAEPPSQSITRPQGQGM